MPYRYIKSFVISERSQQPFGHTMLPVKISMQRPSCISNWNWVVRTFLPFSRNHRRTVWRYVDYQFENSAVFFLERNRSRGVVLLFAIGPDTNIHVFSDSRPISPKPGWTVIYLLAQRNNVEETVDEHITKRSSVREIRQKDV